MKSATSSLNPVQSVQLLSSCKMTMKGIIVKIEVKNVIYSLHFCSFYINFFFFTEKSNFNGNGRNSRTPEGKI